MKYKAAIARPVAEGLVELLRRACRRIEIVGSLRRKKEMVGDIELLCIPKFEEASVDLLGRAHLVDCLDREIKKWIRLGVLDFRKNVKGSTIYGPKNKLLVHVSSNIPVDVFSTDEERWPVALVVRTGSKESNMRVARAAIDRGMKFHAYGRGFTRPGAQEGVPEEIVCRSEREVFEAVGLPYLVPEER